VWDLIKRYWDIFGGFIMGIALTFLAKFQLAKIQLIYSIIILILVLIGVMRILKKSITESRKKPKKERKRKVKVVDNLVDNQKPMKAISLAENPTKEGEKLGNLLIDTAKGVKKVMRKVKIFFDKFKGFMLSILLGIMTAIEMVGGYINDLCKGKFTVHGVDVIPVVTLVCAVLVGIISNGFTKEQWVKIKALFAKSSTNELVQAQIKIKLKETQNQLNSKNKELDSAETVLGNLNSELTNLKNTYNAKVEMMNMTPQLATPEEVQLALQAVNEKESEILAKENDITNINNTIINLNTMINSLKSQLQ